MINRAQSLKCDETTNIRPLIFHGFVSPILLINCRNASMFVFVANIFIFRSTGCLKLKTPRAFTLSWPKTSVQVQPWKVKRTEETFSPFWDTFNLFEKFEDQAQSLDMLRLEQIATLRFRRPPFVVLNLTVHQNSTWVKFQRKAIYIFVLKPTYKYWRGKFWSINKLFKTCNISIHTWSVKFSFKRIVFVSTKQ